MNMDTIFEEPDEHNNGFQPSRIPGRELPSTDSARSRNLPDIGLGAIEIIPSFEKTIGLSSLRQKAKSVTVSRSFHKSQAIYNPQLVKLRKDFFKTKMVQINDDNLTPNENEGGNDDSNAGSNDNSNDNSNYNSNDNSLNNSNNSSNNNSNDNSDGDNVENSNNITHNNAHGVVRNKNEEDNSHVTHDVINIRTDSNINNSHHYDNNRRQISSLSLKNVVLRGNEITGNFSEGCLPKYGNLQTNNLSRFNTSDNNNKTNDNDKNDSRNIDGNTGVENKNEDEDNDKDNENSTQIPTMNVSSGRYGSLKNDNKGFRKMAFKNIFRSNVTYFDSADYYNQPNDKPKPKSHLQNPNSLNSKDPMSHITRKSSVLPEDYYDKSKHNSDTEDNGKDINVDGDIVDGHLGNNGEQIGHENNNHSINVDDVKLENFNE